MLVILMIIASPNIRNSFYQNGKIPIDYSKIVRINATCKYIVVSCKVVIGVAPITQLRTCVIKMVTFKGGHLMW